MRNDVHGVFTGKSAGAFEVGDFVFTEESFNTFCERGDDSGFVLLGFCPVKTGTADIDTECLEVVVQLVVLVGDIEKGL